MIVRLLLLAAAAIGGGAVIGRRAVNHQIEKQLPTEIEAAQARAVVELNKRISQVIAERLTAFGLSLAIKAGLIGGVYLLHSAEHLTREGFRIVVGFLIAAFVIRDAVKTLPFILPAWRLARANRWSPRLAFKEFVAGVAFERAYAETMTIMEAGPKWFWLALSKYTAHSISQDVAQAVADIARQTNFERVKWRAIIAAGLAMFMLAVYIAFFLMTVGA